MKRIKIIVYEISPSLKRRGDYGEDYFEVDEGTKQYKKK